MERYQPSILAGFFLAGFCVLAGAAEKEAPGFSAGVSYDTTQGYYGGKDLIKTRSTTAIIDYERGDFLWSVSIPYLDQYGPTGLLLVRGKPLRRGGRVVFLPRAKTISSSTTGLGDINASATFFYDDPTEGAPLLDVKINAKLATADEARGLGTGKNDYSIQGDVSQSFGAVIVSGTFGYTLVGKISAVDLRDYVFAGFDVSGKIGKDARIGLAYNYVQSSVRGGGDSQDLSLSLAYDISKSLKLQAYLMKGLNDGSPDRGAGLNLRLAF